MFLFTCINPYETSLNAYKLHVRTNVLMWGSMYPRGRVTLRRIYHAKWAPHVFICECHAERLAYQRTKGCFVCIYRQTSNISRTLVGDEIVRRCSNCNSILDLTHVQNIMHKNNCKTRRETFKFWDLLRIILEIWRYVSFSRSVSAPQNLCSKMTSLLISPLVLHRTEWKDL